MMFKAAVSNKAHPEYGQAVIPFPIPDSEYDRTIGLLEDMDIGSPTGQDCRVDRLDSQYPILNRLTTQNVNVDELDYLAKRLDGFCEGEGVQFQAMACKLGLADVRDLINLTFCCQQVTVITDFSDLEKIGKEHCMHLNGGMMTAEEYDGLEGRNAALDLILNNAGAVTPYGVVYDNGMKLEQVYDGGSFPQYLHGDPLLTLGVPIQPEIGGPIETAWLYLPAPEQWISRTLRRIGITNSDATYDIEDSTLLPKVFAVVEHPDDAILDLNRMCRAISPMDMAETEKLEAVVLMTRADSASEVRQLAENLDQFDFMPKQDSPAADSALTELGYVAYHGSLTLEELMRDNPVEQEPQMGGF